MLQYLNLLDRKWAKMKAAKAVSDALGQKPHYAKNLRAWTNNYIKFRTIPVIEILSISAAEKKPVVNIYHFSGHITRRGLHVKTITFLWDEDIVNQIKSFIRSNKFE
ncbi:8390_t:CDS:2, partial [Gigaspora margarita]